MQRYGAPTRLLEWTDSSSIARYFAVRDNPGHYDSVVWMLDPCELNWRVAGKDEVIAPSAQGVSRRDAKRVAPWLPERWSRATIPDDPIAIFPTHIARRISSQRACFTIHGSKEFDFSRFMRSDSILKKIILPGRWVKDIRQSLEQIGIDDTTIFPDLEGLGRALATSHRMEKENKPHSNVYVRLKPSKVNPPHVGVFAIKPIPKGHRIFAGENEEVLWVKKSAIPNSGPFKKMYDDFSIIDGDNYGCPTSFNRMTPAWFMGESKKPNAHFDANYDFYSLRAIAPGEEITVDFSAPTH